MFLNTAMLRYKQKAMRTVRTHVKLVSETVKSDDMVKALRDTAACEWKGESFVSGSGSEIFGSNRSDNLTSPPVLMMMLPSRLRPDPQEPLCQMRHDLLRATAAFKKTPRSLQYPLDSSFLPGLQAEWRSRHAAQREIAPLREGRLPKLMGAALSCRLTADGSLPSTDAILMLDGGREGLVFNFVGLQCRTYYMQTCRRSAKHFDEQPQRRQW